MNSEDFLNEFPELTKLNPIKKSNKINHIKKRDKRFIKGNLTIRKERHRFKCAKCNKSLENTRFHHFICNECWNKYYKNKQRW